MAKLSSKPSEGTIESPPTAQRRAAFNTEMGIQNRRVTGVTRNLLRAYQQSPGRFLPKTKALDVLANMRKPGEKGAV